MDANTAVSLKLECISELVSALLRTPAKRVQRAVSTPVGLVQGLVENVSS